MKILCTLALLSVALPAGAYPSLPPKPTVPTGLGAVSDSTADRGQYSQKAHDDVRDWQEKLHDFDAKTKAEGKDADKAAEADLHKAWDKTEIASRKLQNAGAAGWGEAKAEYEKASRDLADTWHRIQAEHS